MKKKKIIILCSLILLFIINTILVYFKLTSNFDDSIHRALYGIYSSKMESFMKTITFFGSTKWITFFAIFICILYYFNNKSKTYITGSIIILSTIINNIIKPIIHRARPLNMLVYEKSLSYPSGHTMASTTMYGILIYYIIKSNFPKKYKLIYSIFLSIFILSICFSRIYLRAHFLTDVIGGILCSLILILITDILNDKYKWIK